MWFDLQVVGGVEGLGDFAIERGKGSEDRHVVVVEPHLHFVVDGGTARANFVGLPKAGNFGPNQLFQSRQILFRHRDAVERGKKLANATAFEHH